MYVVNPTSLASSLVFVKALSLKFLPEYVPSLYRHASNKLMHTFFIHMRELDTHV